MLVGDVEGEGIIFRNEKDIDRTVKYQVEVLNLVFCSFVKNLNQRDLRNLAMFKAVCLFSILVATSAFSTSYATQKSILLKAFEGKDQIGALPPIGYWDPLGLIANGPYGTPEQNFHHYRSVETKHGRIAGVAIVGLLTAEVSRFSGFLSPSENLKFEDMPNGLAGLAKVPPAGERASLDEDENTSHY